MIELNRTEIVGSKYREKQDQKQQQKQNQSSTNTYSAHIQTPINPIASYIQHTFPMQCDRERAGLCSTLSPQKQPPFQHHHHHHCCRAASDCSLYP